MAPESLPRFESVVSPPSRAGICLVDFSQASEMKCVETFREFHSSGKQDPNLYTFVQPATQTIPAGFREVARGNELLRGKNPAGFLERHRVIVPQESEIPHILHGKKAATHLSLTITINAPPSIFARQGRPINIEDFLKLMSKDTHDLRPARFWLCATTRENVTFDHYSSSLTDFGGNAIVVEEEGEKRFETPMQTIVRKLKEETKNGASLVHDVRMYSRVIQTSVFVGGDISFVVPDTYTEAVSHHTVTLDQFRRTLERLRPGGRKVQGFVLVLQPDLSSTSAAEAYEILQGSWYVPEPSIMADADKVRAVSIKKGTKIYRSREYSELVTWDGGSGT